MGKANKSEPTASETVEETPDSPKKGKFRRFLNAAYDESWAGKVAARMKE